MAETSGIPDKIKTSIDAVLTLLKSGDLPIIMSKARFAHIGKPMDAWSMSNRIIVAVDYAIHKKAYVIEDGKKKLDVKIVIEGLIKGDYRGFNQWKTVGRNILKGEHASYILAPNFRKGYKRTYTDSEGKKHQLHRGDKEPQGHKVEVEEYQFVDGFFGIPVFGEHQTYGKPIKVEKIKLPKLPYAQVAEHLGIKVIPAVSKTWYGYYSPSAKEIALATPDLGTFFHELAHAVDDHLLKEKTGKGLKGGQDVDQEVVAQMCASTLAYMVGYDVEKVAGYTKGYIEHYSQSKDPEKAVIKLLSRIEGILDYITNFKVESPIVEAEKKADIPKSDAEEIAKKDSKKTLVDNPPPGGWKESDKVPPIQKEESLDDILKKRFAHLSHKQLIARINKKFKNEENDDDEVHELMRRKKEFGLNIKTGMDTYELIA